MKRFWGCKRMKIKTKRETASRTRNNQTKPKKRKEINAENSLHADSIYIYIQSVVANACVYCMCSRFGTYICLREVASPWIHRNKLWWRIEMMNKLSFFMTGTDEFFCFILIYYNFCPLSVRLGTPSTTIQLDAAHTNTSTHYCYYCCCWCCDVIYTIYVDRYMGFSSQSVKQRKMFIFMLWCVCVLAVQCKHRK